MRTFAAITLCVLTLASVPAGPLSGQAREEPFDLLIVGARVIDGTGNPWHYADVAIRDGRIVRVREDLSGAPATRTIDATGMYVVPGFIDLHSHAGDSGEGSRGLTDPDPRYRAAPGLVSQGLTTLVANQDGGGPWPIAEQMAALRELGTGPNTIVLVGHGTVRSEVMGDDHRREATPAEIDRMKALVRRGMEEGAWGVSGGYEYVPMRWATTDESVALVEEVAPWNGVYIVHERASGRQPMWWWPSMGDPPHITMLDAVLETIEVAERTGVTSVETHIKARGSRYWGSSGAIIHQIDRARERGVSIWADQYPYNTTGSDGNMVLISPFVREAAREAAGQEEEPNYTAALRRHLNDPDDAARIRRDIEYEMYRRGGPANILVVDHPRDGWVGKTLLELANELGRTPVETGIALQTEGDPNRPGGGQIRGFSLSELDAENYMAQPWLATATDAGVALPGDGFIHPRYYGTFPRKIARYVMERGVISLEFAIRSMTSLPAQILGLEDRGVLREGNWADVVVFDPDEIEDRSEPLHPYRKAEGIEFVLVNGEFVVEGGETTDALPGRVLTPAGQGHGPATDEGLEE